MDESKRKKTGLVRETLEVSISEDEMLDLLEKAVKAKYPDFQVQSKEVECGMGQGQGYFEQVTFSLIWERPVKITE
jgi:hypothetical protein